MRQLHQSLIHCMCNNKQFYQGVIEILEIQVLTRSRILSAFVLLYNQYCMA